MMIDPNFILLCVDSPETSAAFYAELLGTQPLECSPTFAMFALASGVKLGLWSRHTVEPAAQATSGGGEVGFALPDQAAVDTLHDQWLERGATIIQSPTVVDFGYTFVAQDLDGHRLRAFCLSD